MPEKLTWDEMKNRYPDEFVAIVDPEHDEQDQFLAGVVVGHGKSKTEMLEHLKALNPKHAACRWTGKVHGRVQLVRPVEKMWLLGRIRG